MTNRQQRENLWGPRLLADGAACFRIWAPSVERLSLLVERTGSELAMPRADGGWFELTTDAVQVGDGYSFALPDGRRVPDPASRAQLGDVHGPSQLVDPEAYVWRAHRWRGRPWHEAVIYELHTGTFSPEGTFAGIEARLDYIAGLGVTAIELMPVAQFSGKRGWGYDGVLLYAPHNVYDRPDDLKRLVDAAHERDLMILLDVVYNHFGPDGNYLHLTAPQFFNTQRHTPWGAAIDYTRPEVRAFAIENALYWLGEFRFDGLRLDAIDQIKDGSATHVLVELARTVRTEFPDRYIHLTTEDESNRTDLHERDDDQRVRLYTAEWNDDIHHAAHVAVTEEHDGYYADYDKPVARLAKGLAEGYIYQGEPSANWQGRTRGQPSAHLPPIAFIDFIQNHDQIGNRAFGERLAVLAAPEAVEALSAVLLLSPHIPLLFMGEEWSETRPFLFFTDFHGDLADAVREGRRREFARWSAFSDEQQRARIPDPNACSTFAASKLGWKKIADSGHAARVELVRRLLTFRNREIVPRLEKLGGNAAAIHHVEGSAFHIAWRLGDGSTLSMAANLSANAAETSLTLREAMADQDEASDAHMICHPRSAASDLQSHGALPPWSVIVRIEPLDKRTSQEVTPLERLASAYGIETTYESETGETRRTGEAGLVGVLSALGVPATTPEEVENSLRDVSDRRVSQPLAAPALCYVPEWLRSGRAFGVTCQLYGLRSDRNWGIGDFADLDRLGASVAAKGADFLGVSPLHALFLADAERFSPYAPSSRRFINPLYIALDWLPTDVDEPAEVEDLRIADLVDYRRVLRLKLPALRRAFDGFDAAEGAEVKLAFAAYRRSRGQPLADFAAFEALSLHFVGQSHGAGWQSWPEEFQSKQSATVAAFREGHQADIRFIEWLQWTADTQLAKVQRRLRAAGMRIGLYLDIAVGVAPDGAETWSSQGATLPGLSIGAPPDAFNPQGQNWGLAPLSPALMTSGDTALFRDVLKSNMQSAGAVRIDHVMMLDRLYLVPRGAPTRDGAYVKYPLHEMLDVLGEVSNETETLVIGEDLGTVRAELRDTLATQEVQSYRVLPFERCKDGRFIPPGEWPTAALACISTHDLPTLAGWWEGADIEQRERLDLLSPDQVVEARRAREKDREFLLEVLASEGLDVWDDARADEGPLPPEMAVALHRFLARTKCRLVAVQLEDLVGLRDQVNWPGTIDEHPNWRRRMPLDLEDVAAHGMFSAILEAVAKEGSAPQVSTEKETARTVTATYRLQLRSGMTFDRAAGLAPYLAQLGISHLYVSPIFTAAPGSTHGYDVTDPTELDPSLGGDEGFSRLRQALTRAGIGLIVDFVPNHMAMSPAAPWFRDVLEWGEESAYAQHFDIDWSAPRLLLPVLGESYGHALEGGNFAVQLDSDEGALQLAYGALRFPLTPTSYGTILGRCSCSALSQLAVAFAASRPDSAASLKRQLRQAVTERGARQVLLDALDQINSSAEALDALINEQPWRAAHWRAARDMLTHRRFFEISDLIGLTVERQKTFEDLHRRLLDLVAAGAVDGIRLDHIDGLADPTAYLHRLHADLQGIRPVPLYVEKILEQGEVLRPDWPVAGTTGYEFIAAVAGLLVNPNGGADLTAAYVEFTDVDPGVDIVRSAKREIVSRNLASELSGLTTLAKDLAARYPEFRDLGPDTLRRGLLALIGEFPVYRTYVDASGAGPDDTAILDAALARARKAGDVEDETVFDFLAATLKLKRRNPNVAAAALEFVTRFQQVTGPTMAKAVEDTVFYRVNRLIALNEVGGDPLEVGASVDAFHAAMIERQRRMPCGLSATATHDTKRGEDARARIYAISEAPTAWADCVKRWSALNAPCETVLDDGRVAPSRNDAWLFYQSLLGAWPGCGSEPIDDAALADLVERMAAFMLKAVREAKVETSWTAPNSDYETAVDKFVRAALDKRASVDFLDDVALSCGPFVAAGRVNSLAQVLIKLTAPGVPDIYQGTEQWDLSLVDPDNRRASDWSTLTTTLRSGEAPMCPGGQSLLLRDWRTKLHLLTCGLADRASRVELYVRGAYVPLAVEGPRAAHVVAFARLLDGDCAISVVTRLMLPHLDEHGAPPAPNFWQGTRIRLPGSCSGMTWHDRLTQCEFAATAELDCSCLFAVLPVALLANCVDDPSRKS